jgi:hypothetical protein
MSEPSVACDVGNEYDGRMGLRISAVFVVLVGSMFGMSVNVFSLHYFRRGISSLGRPLSAWELPN